MMAEQCMTRPNHFKLCDLEEGHYRSTQWSESQRVDGIDSLKRVYKVSIHTHFDMVGQDMLAL